MNVKELTFRGEAETRLYSCGACGQCYSPKIYACKESLAHETARAAAEKCCVPPTCSVCGIEVQSPWTMCAMHREQAALRRAVAIPATEWNDPVQSDSVTGDWGGGEGYCSDVDALLEQARDHVEWGDIDEVPAYCWPCVSDELRLDVESLLEQVAEGHHEDAGEQIEAGDELVAFIEEWNAKQTCKSWYPDRKRVVVLDQNRFEALLEGYPT